MSDFQIFTDEAISYLLAIVFVLILGALLINLAPAWNAPRTKKLVTRWLRALSLDELGGYVHDTAMSQYIPPTAFHCATATATWTDVAGDVAGTISKNLGAANETSLVTIPITAPSNSVAQKGAYLKSVEVDYENKGAEFTSYTWTLNKVTRGADGAIASVAAVTKTDAILAADSHSVDQHKQVITITTPFWIDNDEYCLLEASIVHGAGGGTAKFLAAVANFTLRV